MLTNNNNIDDHEINIVKAALDFGARIIWIFTRLSPSETDTILATAAYGTRLTRNSKAAGGYLRHAQFLSQDDDLPPSTCGHTGDIWITPSHVYAYGDGLWRIMETARQSRPSHPHLKNRLLTFNPQSGLFEWPTGNHSRQWYMPSTRAKREASTDSPNHNVSAVPITLQYIQDHLDTISAGAVAQFIHTQFRTSQIPAEGTQHFLNLTGNLLMGSFGPVEVDNSGDPSIICGTCSMCKYSILLTHGNTNDGE